MRLWDPDAGTGQATLSGHDGWVNAVAFSPDGQRHWLARHAHVLAGLTDPADVAVTLVDTRRASHSQRSVSTRVEISERTLQTGRRGGIFVRVPRFNVIATAREPWETAAEKFASTAAEDYEDNLSRLAPSTAGIVRNLAEASSQDDASMLCAHLARGRNAPELTIRTLLIAMPHWLTSLGADGYAALADFAYSHGADDLAVEALLASANRFSSHELRFTTSAGLIALNFAPDRARDLLESAQAISPDFSARVEIGLLVLGHPAAAAPIPVPADLAARLAAINDDAFVLAFLAAQHALANDLNAAVDLAEKALTLEPDGWQHLSTLAHLLTRRSRSAQRRPDDQERAIKLAERAVDQLHQWNGPTEQALRTLLRVLTLAGSFSKVLDRTLPPPDGRAVEREAARPEVISAAAAAARALDRTELADSLIDSLPDGIDKRFALARQNMPPGDPDSARAEWTALLDMLDESRPEQLAQAVMRLADLGVDQLCPARRAGPGGLDHATGPATGEGDRCGSAGPLVRPARLARPLRRG